MGGAVPSLPSSEDHLDLLNVPWSRFTADQLNDLDDAFERQPPRPIERGTWHRFLRRMLPLTRLPHEVAGRASRINGELVVHYLCPGTVGHVPPEVMDDVVAGFAECYFHVHPAERGDVACWPSAEDAIEDVRSFARLPNVARYMAIVTHCGLVVTERGPGWDVCAVEAAGWRYQRNIYLDLQRGAEGMSLRRFQRILDRHGISMHWIPLNRRAQDAARSARRTLTFDEGIMAGLQNAQIQET